MSEHKQEEFQPRFWNPGEQDVDEAIWCVKTNPPHTCAHDPECRDVFYAEILRLRELLEKDAKLFENMVPIQPCCGKHHKGPDCPFYGHECQVNNLNQQIDRLYQKEFHSSQSRDQFANALKELESKREEWVNANNRLADRVIELEKQLTSRIDMINELRSERDK